MQYEDKAARMISVVRDKKTLIALHQAGWFGWLTVGILVRPQCSVPDFRREPGALFGVQLSPHNRRAGAKALRERQTAHIDAAMFRAMLIIDEAREMHPAVLNELRLLSAARLDASSLLTTVFCGDERLPDKFRARE
ncbi:MAG: ATP-binding protein, partial [Gammaproteobacteria bacterium]|nr:ATP-binding protein [Gammaproteobacteria bacterium]